MVLGASGACDQPVTTRLEQPHGGSREGSNLMSLRPSNLDLSPARGWLIRLQPDPRERRPRTGEANADMTIADVTLAVFASFNSLRFLAYVPQIARAYRDQSGAEAISFATWALFLASHLSATAYAIVNQRDWTMAVVFLGNALGCGIIILIAGVKRSRHRRRCRTGESLLNQSP
jgi:hypothetical protein